MKSAPRQASALAPDVPRREVLAWAMYDFANSGYTTVVITAVFNAYFVAVVAGNAPWATLLWTLTLAVSYAAIMLTAPAIGAWADLRAAKKRLLWIATIGCVTGTAALSLAGPETLVLTCVLVVVSNFFFGTGENVAAAFLPELAHGEALGRVSGWGWSLGYLGGLVTLGLCLAYVTGAQRAGATAARVRAGDHADHGGHVRARRAADVPGAARARRAAGGHRTRRRRRCLRAAGRHGAPRAPLSRPRTFPGVPGVLPGRRADGDRAGGHLRRAGDGLHHPETIVLILVVNVTAALGAFAFGYVQDRLGHVRTIALTLCGWIVMILLAWWATDRVTFWVAANLAGICLGSSQSAGRALVGYLSPSRHRAEFFGLWGLAVKLSSILGPVTYGAVTWLSDGDHRLAMLITGSYFVIGLAILATINVRRGRIAAKRADRDERFAAARATASAAS